MQNERTYYINKMGTTRTVFMFRKFVIKVPTAKSWKLFLNGLLANITERTFCKMEGCAGLPTVLFSDPLGFVVIARRVRPVRHRGLFWVDFVTLTTTSAIHPSFWERDCKPENFGYGEGMVLTKIDLG